MAKSNKKIKKCLKENSDSSLLKNEVTSMINIGNTWIVDSGIDPSSIYTSFATASCHHNSHSQVAEHCMLWQNFTALFPVLLYSCCYCLLVQQCFQCHCYYCLLLLSTSPPPCGWLIIAVFLLIFYFACAVAVIVPKLAQLLLLLLLATPHCCCHCCCWLFLFFALPSSMVDCCFFRLIF